LIPDVVAGLVQELVESSNKKDAKENVTIHIHNGNQSETITSEKKETSKEKEESKDSSNLKDHSITIGAIVLGLLSTWHFSKSHGKLDYLEKFEMLNDRIVEKIKTIKLWILERESLGLNVPEIVRSDIRGLETLCDAVNRINHKQETKNIRNSYGIIALSSALVLSSKITSRMTLQTVGFAGLGIGIVSWVYTKAAYSSSYYSNSAKFVASEASAVIDELLSPPMTRRRDRLGMQLKAPDPPQKADFSL
jgi:hypothetical protein